MRHAYTPTLPELQAFAAAARLGSATLAGQALGLTQSAVSRSLAGLEARLGVALFRRERQRLILSDAGRAFLPEAERLLDALDRAALAVMSFGGRGEVLRLACLPTFAAAWLVPRLPGFASAAPQVALDIAATLSLPDFGPGGPDAAILRGPAPPGLAALELAPDRLVCLAAPRLLPGGRPLSDAELARLPLLQQATRPALWRDWLAAGGADPAAIPRGPRFETFAMVLSAARAGLGVALVPEVLAAEDLARGTLAPASARALAGPAPYLLLWPPAAAARPAFAAFRDWLAARPSPFVASPPSPH